MSYETPNGPEELSISLLKKGQQAFQLGQYQESLATLLEAFTLNPGDETIQTHLIGILSCTSGYVLPKSISDQLAEAAIDNGHDVQGLALVLSSQFESNPDVSSLIEILKNAEPGTITEAPKDIDLDAILNDQLFMLVCTRATVISPVIETLLCELRRHSLGEWLADTSSNSFFLANHPAALTSAAAQAFNSEYIYNESPDEQARVENLIATVKEDIRAVHPLDLSILGAYRPLWQILQDCDHKDLQYLMDQASRWEVWSQLIWKLQFLAPLEEAMIKQRLPVLSTINEGVSTIVADQYEAFPYPRWQSAQTGKRDITLAHYISERFPHLQVPEELDAPVDILFAGCGTGEQVVQLGSKFAAKNVLAIDLSLNSLAYANRKKEEYRCDNVHFGQADILQIPEWDASFDFIVSTGVLHHMENPDQGLKALRSCAKDHTVFYLALYSQRARTNIDAAKKLVSEHNIPDTLEGIRAFRDLLKSLPEDHAAKDITKSREFYSTSGLHDLVFNAHEVRFSPKTLKQLLDDNQLEFMGFEIKQPNLLKAYQTTYPEDTTLTDLENWEAFEKEYPILFDGMMQFWCRKKHKPTLRAIE